jgi:hypothetical protein
VPALSGGMALACGGMALARRCWGRQVPALSGGLYSEAFASLLRALLQKEPAERCAHSGTCRYSGVLCGTLGYSGVGSSRTHSVRRCDPMRQS